MKLISLIVLLIVVPFNLLANSNSINNEQSNAVDKIFSDWDKENTPGCGLGIIKDGELIYSRGYGMANLEYDIPNTSKSVFRIGSTSKQFTAASIVLLAEQGKLSLDDSLDNFFPAFPSYAKSINVRHLLNHTSGIRDYLTLSYLKGLGDNDFYTDKDVMAWLINQTELNFTPGEEYVYSNSGYWLLGQIVNQVAGMSMAEYAKKEIFTPLGMDDTHFHNDHQKIVRNRASGYMPMEEGGFQISMTTLDMIGDGGIFTTIDDIKKWDDAYYESKVLSKEFWEMMVQKGKLNNKEEINYASGLSISEYKGLPTVSHGGAFVGFRAELLRFPKERFSVAIFTNRGDANPTSMAYKIADIFLSDQYIVENKIETVGLNESENIQIFNYDEITGIYEIEPGVEFVVSINDKKIHVKQLWNNNEYDLKKINNNTYHIEDASEIKFTFTELKDKHTQKVIIDQEGRITESIRKKEIDLSKIVLKDYTGSYYSKELEVTYKLYLDEGVMKLKVNNNEAVEIAISNIDLFNFEGVLLKFNRDNGVAKEFIMNAGRVKNLKFKKVEQ